MLFSNALAQQWLGAQSGQPLAPSASVRTLLDKALAAVEPGTFETFLAQDGRPLFVAYAPTRYKKQDVILCAFADISARAEIERTLAQAKRDADKASEAKSTFLATMSHEIRTPLYGVLGTLELLGMTDLDAEQRQHLERIQNSSSILLQLISDILDITKIESGQLALESTVFDPRELIESCTSSYAALAHQRPAAVLLRRYRRGALGDGRRRSHPPDPRQPGQQRHQIHRGGPRHRAPARGGPANGNQLLTLQVVDTGIGIGAQEQSQLFLPFYQIDSASHTVRGTGLGLSICARLAKLMNSWIRVTSELGLGSSFSMALSLKPAAGPAPTTPDLAGARVHVRSPHRELSEQVCLWLTMWGAHATPAPRIAAAGDRVRRGAAGCAARRRRPAIRLGRPLPERARAGVRGEYGPDALDGHRLDSIGFGIQALLRGDRATPSAEPAEPEFRLWACACWWPRTIRSTRPPCATSWNSWAAPSPSHPMARMPCRSGP